MTLGLITALLLAPAIANATMTIGTASDTNVTRSGSLGCTWTATSGTSYVNVGELETCLGATSSGATLTNNPTGGGGLIDFTSNLNASACADGATLTLNDTAGVEFNAPVDLGQNNDGCEIQANTPGGALTQGTGDIVTVPSFFVSGGSNGTVSLDDQGNDDNQIGTVGGTAEGGYDLGDDEQLSIDQLNGGSEVLLSDVAGIDVAGTVAGQEVGLAATGSTFGGVVTEGSSARIDAAELQVEGSTVDLPGPNNVAILLESLALSGLTLNDSDSSGLGLGLDEVEIGGASVTNTGAIFIGGGVDMPAGTLSLTSSSGSISEELTSGETVGVQSLIANAPDGSVALSPGSGTNGYGSLGGEAGSGGFTATDNSTSSPLTLSAITSTGEVNVGDTGNQLNVAGVVSAPTIDLSATRLAGSGGSLQAPNIVLNASTAGDTWVLGPGAVADGPGTAISFSGATALAVNASGTYNVTASPTTAFTVTGGSPASSTLNYNAQDRTVSGATSAPTGVIDSPTVEPVNFTNMKTVNLSGVAMSATSATSAAVTTAAQTSPPSCTLTAPSLVLSVSKSKSKGRSAKKKADKPAKLALRATCNSPASLTLAGKVEAGRTYSIPAVSGKLSGPGSTTLSLKIPAAAAAALAKHPGKSASFTLTATDAGSTTSTASLSIAGLR